MQYRCNPPIKKHIPSIERAHRVINGLKAGTVYVNCYDVFDAASPFGGYKQSGIGVAWCFVGCSFIIGDNWGSARGCLGDLG